MRYTNVFPAHYIQTFTGTTSGTASARPGQTLTMSGNTVNTIQQSRGRVRAFQVSSDTPTIAEVEGAFVTIQVNGVNILDPYPISLVSPIMCQDFPPIFVLDPGSVKGGDQFSVLVICVAFVFNVNLSFIFEDPRMPFDLGHHHVVK
jgi:hypothetical protein